MGGPTVQLLVPREVERSEMVAWASTFDDLEEGGRFWISDATSLGLDWRGDGRPLGWSFGRIEDEREPDEVEHVHQLLGATVTQVQLDAFCNRSIDHQLLGHAALQLCERFGGLVNMLCSIQPHSREEVTLEQISEFVRAQPGRVIEVPYLTGLDKPWVYHIVDAEFLRHWLEHPYFRM